MTETPALTGTARQVDWADRIRATWLAGIDELATQIHTNADQQGLLTDPRFLAFMKGFDAERAAILAEHTEASWWIDRRPVDYAEGPDRAARKGRLSELDDRIKRAGIAARDSHAA
jgi:hypothetical protein